MASLTFKQDASVKPPQNLVPEDRNKGILSQSGLVKVTHNASGFTATGHGPAVLLHLAKKEVLVGCHIKMLKCFFFYVSVFHVSAS